MANSSELGLEEVAEAAGISRATMYRYYPNADLLISEAALQFRTKTTEELATEVEAMPLKESLLHVQQYFNKLIQENEATFRKYLTAALKESIRSGDGSVHRSARRTAMAAQIISSKGQDLSEEDQKNLVLILAVLSGVEPFVANCDVNNISPEASGELLQWALEKILKGIEKG